MPALHSLQETLRHAILLGNVEPVAAELVPGPVSDMSQIHANHFRISLGEALTDTFPVTRRIVGDGCFAALARHYILADPPKSPCLFEYGESLADFIRQFSPCDPLPYLSDLTRFEWALNEAAHAEDAAALSMEGLADISPERAGRLRFIPHPAARLVSSDYPVARIWQVSQPDVDSDQEVDLDEGGINILVTRPGLTVEWRAVPASTAALFRKLQAGTKLTDALTADIGPDAAAGLHILLTAGAFHGLSPEYAGMPGSDVWRIDNA